MSGGVLWAPSVRLARPWLTCHTCADVTAVKKVAILEMGNIKYTDADNSEVEEASKPTIATVADLLQIAEADAAS